MLRTLWNPTLLVTACAAILFIAAPAHGAKTPDRLSGFMLELRAPGAERTAGTAVNSSGTVAGTCAQHGADHAFVWQDGQFTLFDAPGASATVPRGIDDKGTIVGHCFVKASGSGLRMLGFIRHPDGRIETLDRIDPSWVGTHCAVTGISSGGEMLAVAETNEHAFLFRGHPGAWKAIDDKFLLSLEFGAINKSGALVGTIGGWGNPVRREAFVLRKNGKSDTIEYPGAYITIGVGLNDLGEVVGRWGSSERLTCFYRDASGQCYWRDDPRSIDCGANAISNNGYIVGYDRWSLGTGVGWLYRPGPRQSEKEPSVPMRWRGIDERPEGMPVAERQDFPPPPVEPAPVLVPAPPPGPPYDGLIDRLAAELDPAIEKNDWGTVVLQSVISFATDSTRWEPYLYLGMAERHLLMKAEAYRHLSEGIRLAKADFEAHPDRTFIKKHLATMYLEHSWRAIDLRDFDGASQDVWLARQMDPGPRVDRQGCISQVIIDSRYMGNICEKAAPDYMDDPVVRAGRGIGRMPMLRQFRRSGAPHQWQETKDDFEFYLSRGPSTGTNAALIRRYLAELDHLD